MNPEIKQRWIEALRSGKYKQGKGRLKAADGALCCLGVLSELSGIPYAGEEGLLPTEIVGWAGLSERNPFAGQCSLAAENDRGTAFPEIADLIEKYL